MYLGTYTDHASINVAKLKASSASQFLVVPSPTSTISGSGYRRWATGGNWTAYVYFWPASVTLNNNTLNVVLPRATMGCNSGNTQEGLMSAGVTIPAKIYFIENVANL